MWKRNKVRLYLRSGQVVKFRVSGWTAHRDNSTGELTQYQFERPVWANRRLITVATADIAAFMVSRW